MQRFLPPFIIQSDHYNTIRTTYVVEPKILQYSAYATVVKRSRILPED